MNMLLWACGHFGSLALSLWLQMPAIFFGYLVAVLLWMLHYMATMPEEKRLLAARARYSKGTKNE